MNNTMLEKHYGAVLLQSLLIGGETAPPGLCLFEDLRQERVWEAIVAVVGERKTLDVVEVARKLKDTGKLEEAGGSAFLAELIDAKFEFGKEEDDDYDKKEADQTPPSV